MFAASGKKVICMFTWEWIYRSFPLRKTKWIVALFKKYL